MSAVTTVSRAQGWAPKEGRIPGTLLMLATAVGAWFVVPDAIHAARYATRRPWLLAHIACGTVALLVGPFQLWLGLGRRSLGLHRRLGIAYSTAVAAGSMAAFVLAAQTRLGWVFKLGILGLGIAWFATTALAVVAMRRGLVAQHQEWAIRSYVVTFAFVTFRAFWGVLEAMGVGTHVEQLAAASWLCWAGPLFLTEMLLQGRKIALLRAKDLRAPRPSRG